MAPDDKAIEDGLRMAREVVLRVARGAELTADLDIRPAIDLELAQCKPFSEEGGFPGLVLTDKGHRAAARWLELN